MVKLWGIQADYYAPQEGKHYTTYGEIDSNYCKPIKVGVLFNEHPDQRTAKKLGWDNELDINTILVTAPYDTPSLQVGSMFGFPAAVDGGEARLYRVIRMKTSMVMPSGVICECAPEYKDEYNESDFVFKRSGVNLVNREEDNL